MPVQRFDQPADDLRAAGIIDRLPVTPRIYQPSLAQPREMLRDSRLAELNAIRHLMHSHLLGKKMVHDPKPFCIGKNAKQICGFVYAAEFFLDQQWEHLVCSQGVKLEQGGLSCMNYCNTKTSAVRRWHLQGVSDHPCSTLSAVTASVCDQPCSSGTVRLKRGVGAGCNTSWWTTKVLRATL